MDMMHRKVGKVHQSNERSIRLFTASGAKAPWMTSGIFHELQFANFDRRIRQ